MVNKDDHFCVCWGATCNSCLSIPCICIYIISGILLYLFLNSSQRLCILWAEQNIVELERCLSRYSFCTASINTGTQVQIPSTNIKTEDGSPCSNPNTGEEETGGLWAFLQAGLDGFRENCRDTEGGVWLKKGPNVDPYMKWYVHAVPLVHTHAHTHTHTHICMHTHTHTGTRTCAHAHTLSLVFFLFY